MIHFPKSVCSSCSEGKRIMWKTTLPLRLKLLTFREMRHSAGSSHCELLVRKVNHAATPDTLRCFLSTLVSLWRDTDGLKMGWNISAALADTLGVSDAAVELTRQNFPLLSRFFLYYFYFSACPVSNRTGRMCCFGTCINTRHRLNSFSLIIL